MRTGRRLSPRALVQALAAVASRYTPEASREKVRLLEILERRPVSHPGTLLRLHETLCFLHAYPDDPDVLSRVDRALTAIPSRVARLAPPARRRVADTGVALSEVEYPFGLPMTHWLLGRFGGSVDADWATFSETERLEETVGALVSRAEADAFSEGGLGWATWPEEIGRASCRERV